MTGKIIAGIVVLLTLQFSAACARAQAARPRCFIDLPVFDSAGAPLLFKVTTLTSGDPGLDSFTRQAVLDGNRIYFPERLVSAGVLHVTLTNSRGRNLKTSLDLTSCRQRTSLQYGQMDTGMDVGISSISGRIAGCQMDRNWWVRAMPMFGGHIEYSTYEGYIDPTSGSFTITARMRGERHILVIGKWRDPVKVLGVNVTSGAGRSEVGEIQLQSSDCVRPGADERIPRSVK